MKLRHRWWITGLIAIAVFVVRETTIAQEGPGRARRDSRSRGLARDAHPDLQGIWTNGTLTPLERPTGQNKAFLSEEEAAAVEREAAERREHPRPARPGDIGGDNEAFVDTGYKVTSTRQTSLIVDPPDGRIPLRPEAEQKRDFNLKNTDDFETMSPWDRCITRGPTAMFPAGYNNAYQIIQTPTAVTIFIEEIHEARIIPLDGGPHLDSRIRLWEGDSRGRWEGKTLVVDTTNFHDRGWITTHAGSGRIRGLPHSDALHIVERFQLTDPNTIIYEMTVEDPKIYTRPWTFSIPLVRDSEYRIFEYACHEGNMAIELGMRGSRIQEREAAGRENGK